MAASTPEILRTEVSEPQAHANSMSQGMTTSATTSSLDSPPPGSWFRPIPSPSLNTELPRSKPTGIPVLASAREAIQVPIGGVAREIGGTVLAVTPPSVQCEFFFGTPNVTRVWLPESLFPPGTAAGFTFFLSMNLENGFRAPRISPRVPSKDSASEARFEQLMQVLRA
jgi:hypothetical protein